jgi:hypothetical protein
VGLIDPRDRHDFYQQKTKKTLLILKNKTTRFKPDDFFPLLMSLNLLLFLHVKEKMEKMKSHGVLSTMSTISGSAISLGG